MSRHHKKIATSVAPAHVAKTEPGSSDYLRRGLLAAAAALLVARTMVPSDGGPWVGDGQPFALFWLLVGILWTLGALGRRKFEVRFGWIEALLVAWVAWWSVAALLGARHGAPRPSLNMLWEAVGTGAAFLALRQLVQRPREWRAVVAVMIALGVAEAGLAFEQYFVTMPAHRARFAKHPELDFGELGEPLPSLDSSDFKHLQDRVNSTEPIATFTLTNSLAALLGPWLVMVAGIALLGGRAAGLRWRLWLLAAACGVPLTAALALTRSRSAWIGVLAGLAGVAWLAWRKRETGKRTGRLALAGFAILLAIGAAVAVVKPAFLEPALRSLRFRGEYWEATARLIDDHPVWGCGPGNFKEYYTGYKLPEASEEVSDPHNFALEIAANAGLPALALLMAILAAFGWRVWNSLPLPEGEGTRPMARDGMVWILVGGLVGFWLGLVWNLIFGFEARFEQVVACTLAAGVVLAIALPWIRGGVLPVGLLGVAVATLLVALLAVGGITFGGVAGTLWLLVAAGASATDRPAAQPKSLPFWSGWLMLAGLVALGIFQYRSSYEPFLTGQSALADAVRQFAKGNGIEAQKLFTTAAQADPWMPQPRRALAQISLTLWQITDHADPSHRQSLYDFEKWIKEAERIDPLSSEIWLEAGRGWREIYWVEHQAAYGDKAVQACRRAVELYPNSPLLQAELAATLSATGHAAEARAAAREALRLDGLTPHEDKKLSVEQRKTAERIAK